MRATLLRTVLIGLCLEASVAPASILVEYDIPASKGLNAPAINLADGVRADPMVLIGGTGGDEQQTGVIAAKNWMRGGSGNVHKYIEFAVAPESGHRIEYHTISFTLFREDSGSKTGPAVWDLYASTDAFATPGALLLSADISGSGDSQPVLFSGRDISALRLQTGTVTFRFLPRDAEGAQGSAGLGNPLGSACGDTNANLIIAGTLLPASASATPEPLSVSLFGVSGAGLFLARRRG
jgi:hypothetical protein